MTSTVTAAASAWTYQGPGPKSNQITKVAMATQRMTGTKTAETRSASLCIGALVTDYGIARLLVDGERLAGKH
jgi:hypothetical protein